MTAPRPLFDHSNPYPTYARLREQSPVFAAPWGLVLTRYDDCHVALRDSRFGVAGFDELFKSVYGQYAQDNEQSRIPRSVLFSNPPDHTRLRSLIGKAFTSRVIEGMRSNIQGIVDGLLDRQDGAGSMDLIDDLAYPLPFTVICNLLGVPLTDHPEIRSWSEDIARSVDAFLRPTDEIAIRGNIARQKLIDYFRAVIPERQHAPRDDLLSMLITAEETGDKLSMGELLATCVLLFVAGHETTVNLIGNGTLALLQHPDEFERLRADPMLLEDAIEEMLRYDPPVQRTVRTPVEDVEMSGYTFKKGAVVMVAIGSANRDPAQFTDPDRFDIGRRDSRHLSFGFGIHFCLGAVLARMEAQIAIGTLLRRIPRFELATSNLEWRESSTVRGLKSLPIAW